MFVSCFAAGTPVQTLGGTRPIEAIQVGDLILTEEPDTGRLSFRPAVSVFHNTPQPTVKLEFETGPAIVATGIHRFWKARQGWVMARDLQPGDAVRSVGGVDRVVRTSDEAVQPVFNLEVAHGASFFVGEPGLLVHDITLVEPVAAPFDALPAAPQQK
jgi:hypothetical protein